MPYYLLRLGFPISTLINSDPFREAEKGHFMVAQSVFVPTYRGPGWQGLMDTALKGVLNVVFVKNTHVWKKELQLLWGLGDQGDRAL